MPEKETVDFLEDDEIRDYHGIKFIEWIIKKILERDKAMQKKGREDGFYGARESETVGYGGVATGLGPVYHTFKEFEEKRGKE